ncbi:MAG TPA: hypothetical protein EYM34_09245 [Alphaproteobacteria bacterium]|nr:hypothetical protein [Alphaproteobacteria bacterium]
MAHSYAPPPHAQICSTSFRPCSENRRAPMTIFSCASPLPGAAPPLIATIRAFFTRATERVLTCWLGLSDLSVEQGSLYVVEGSHRWKDHISAMRGFDLERAEGKRRATLADNIIRFVEAHRARLLTTRFGAGDILLFSMYLIHGAFDNRAPGKLVRVSCDVRWQPASEPFDPRYMAAGLKRHFRRRLRRAQRGQAANQGLAQTLAAYQPPVSSHLSR